MSMCLVVCTAIFALGMIFTLPGALRRRGLAVWLVRRGEPIGHSMCTSDAWRHGDSVEREPWRLV